MDIYTVQSENTVIYIKISAQRGDEGGREDWFWKESKSMLQSHGGSSPMVTVKTENTKLLTLSWLELGTTETATDGWWRSEGARCRGRGASNKKRDQSEPKLVLQASAGKKS